MTKRTKRLFPRRMQSDFINTSQGIDRYAHGELYTEHVNSLRHGVTLPQTQLDESVLRTPRGQADVSAYAEKSSRLSLTTKEVEHRLSEIKKWNYFRVTPQLTLHFKMREWVFLKVIKEGLIFSIVYESKEKALCEYYRGKIFWAGEG